MNKLSFISFAAVITSLCWGTAATAQSSSLNGVTFGFGAGYSYSFNRTFDYSLSTDGNFNLNSQSLNKGGFVLSSVVMVKLAKLTYKPSTTENSLRKGNDETRPASFSDRLSVNIALNLVDIKPDVSFNKNIDGGIGMGYFFNDNLQLAVFYDVSRIRQLRDYIVTDFMNKPIPSGKSTIFNALDTSNNDLFYYKTISGLSLKLVYSIGNKKN